MKQHTLNIRFPAEKRREIRMAAAELDLSMNAWILRAIEEKLERQKAQE